LRDNRYPHLDKFSKAIGIPAERLSQAFEIEKTFHENILREQSFETRQALYKNVYATVHAIYGKDSTDIFSEQNPNDATVRLFSKELMSKSVLDVGCGEGHFLASISKNLRHKELVGLDVSIPRLSLHHPDIAFKLGDIVQFNLRQEFDVVFSDQVLEHIAPVDLKLHLDSVRSSLKAGGLFIVNMPNRLFGPSDVTRIVDFSNTGRIEAQGTHLNESTYTDLIPILEQNGFRRFRTVCPIPKLKYRLTKFRMAPSLLRLIENRRVLLSLLHRIQLRGRCIAQFDVTLICTKT